ncbi:lipase maturation factor family protein [Pelotalea chapellei]|uniref:Lipase maturation factor family protein n=1 Tax=Pelotalea chapellei TaxID=44671 RepID=A0ABS5U9Q9_9BACT|nr:lipase maturation factor family protein [Pelotalea chapellei]MBT1072389.1 lipase maturation factor family protein [Pelotalea chapellei]
MEADGYWLIRLFLQRGLGFIYLMAFLVALNQFRPLCGDKGLLPARHFIKAIPFRNSPSIFYMLKGDRYYFLFAILGVALSLCAASGLSDAGGTFLSMLVWFLLWIIYLSYVNIGQTFYAFGWESLLLESGFLAIFLGPSTTEPHWVVIWLFRWLAFRVMFGAGLIKLRGDPCWRDLTCLDYHFESQPMPNPLSRLFHRLPQWLHKAGVLFNHLAEVALPILFFAPQPVAGIAACICLLFLGSIIVSGNFAWLNWLTAILCLSPLDGSYLADHLPVHAPLLMPRPPLFEALIWGLLILVVIKSWQPVRNLISKAQLMNTSFDPFHLVNTYGAFGSITRDRYEIIIEGTEEMKVTPLTAWKEYEFRGKPGNPLRRPPFIAPYHLRLDWLMWFEAMPSRGFSPWFINLVAQLLLGERQIIGLLARNPFPDAPPRFIRCLYYSYSFGENEWWERQLIGEFLPPLSVDSPVLKRVYSAHMPCS